MAMAEKVKRPVGRPSKYSVDLGLLICSLVAEGKPLTRICKLDDMPGLATIYRWELDHDEFREALARAREDMAHTMAGEALDIADEDPQLISAGEQDGGAVVKIDNAFETWRRTKIDTRKWFAAVMNPKKYSERIKQEVSGPDGKALQTVAPIVNLTVEVAK
jgi:hypothetical protein